MWEILLIQWSTCGNQITTCTGELSKLERFTSFYYYYRVYVSHHLNIRKVLQAFQYGLREFMFLKETNLYENTLLSLKVFWNYLIHSSLGCVGKVEWPQGFKGFLISLLFRSTLEGCYNSKKLASNSAEREEGYPNNGKDLDTPRAAWSPQGTAVN